jgi:hypothetical protein
MATVRNFHTGNLCCAIFLCLPITTGQMIQRNVGVRENRKCVAIAASLWFALAWTCACLVGGMYVLLYEYPRSRVESCVDDACSIVRDSQLLTLGGVLLGAAFVCCGLAWFAIVRFTAKIAGDGQITCRSCFCCHWSQYVYFRMKSVSDEKYQICSGDAV